MPLCGAQWFGDRLRPFFIQVLFMDNYLIVLAATAECPLKYNDIIVYSALLYRENNQRVKKSIRNLVKISGLGRYAVSDCLFNLKDYGLYEDGHPQKAPVGWFNAANNKVGFQYFLFCPPSAKSPLSFNQHLIYSLVLHLHKQGKVITAAYLAKLLKFERHTITANCKALIKNKLIDDAFNVLPLSAEQDGWSINNK